MILIQESHPFDLIVSWGDEANKRFKLLFKTDLSDEDRRIREQSAETWTLSDSEKKHRRGESDRYGANEIDFEPCLNVG